MENNKDMLDSPAKFGVEVEAYGEIVKIVAIFRKRNQPQAWLEEIVRQRSSYIKSKMAENPDLKVSGERVIKRSHEEARKLLELYRSNGATEEDLRRCAEEINATATVLSVPSTKMCVKDEPRENLESSMGTPMPDNRCRMWNN